MTQPATALDSQTPATPMRAHVYLLLVLGLCAAYAWSPLIGGFDFWAHAAVGHWIEAHRQPPTESLFLWGEPVRWIAHSWLAEFGFYELLQHGGPGAVVAMTELFALLVFGLLWRFWSRRAAVSIIQPWLFAVAIWCSSARFQPRQELISALFLFLLLSYLIAWSEPRTVGGEARPWRIPLKATVGLVMLFALWINLHALVATGLIVFLVTVVCDALQDGGDRRARWLGGVFLLCLLATLLNPYGIGYWAAADQLLPGGMSKYLEEWKPFWQAPQLSYGAVAGEAILALSAIAMWRANPRRRWSQLAWVLLFSVLFVKSRRMLWLLAIVCLAVAGANAGSLDVGSLWRRWRRLSGGDTDVPPEPGMRLIARAGTICCLALWAFSAVMAHYQEEKNPWQAVSGHLPEGAVRYVLAHNLQGRIFNDYEYSSYLQWRFNGPTPETSVVSNRGRRPLYLDLLNAYPDKLLDDYLDTLEGKPGGFELLDRKRIDYIVLGTHHIRSPLVRHLVAARSRWTLVFHDKNALVWVRRVPRFQPLWQVADHDPRLAAPLKIPPKGST